MNKTLLFANTPDGSIQTKIYNTFTDDILTGSFARMALVNASIDLGSDLLRVSSVNNTLSVTVNGEEDDDEVEREVKIPEGLYNLEDLLEQLQRLLLSTVTPNSPTDTRVGLEYRVTTGSGSQTQIGFARTVDYDMPLNITGPVVPVRQVVDSVVSYSRSDAGGDYNCWNFVADPIISAGCGYYTCQITWEGDEPPNLIFGLFNAEPPEGDDGPLPLNSYNISISTVAGSYFFRCNGQIKIAESDAEKGDGLLIFYTPYLVTFRIDTAGENSAIKETVTMSYHQDPNLMWDRTDDSDANYPAFTIYSGGTYLVNPGYIPSYYYNPSGLATGVDTYGSSVTINFPSITAAQFWGWTNDPIPLTVSASSTGGNPGDPGNFTSPGAVGNVVTSPPIVNIEVCDSAPLEAYSGVLGQQVNYLYSIPALELVTDGGAGRRLVYDTKRPVWVDLNNRNPLNLRGLFLQLRDINHELIDFLGQVVINIQVQTPVNPPKTLYLIQESARALLQEVEGERVSDPASVQLYDGRPRVPASLRSLLPRLLDWVGRKYYKK